MVRLLILIIYAPFAFGAVGTWETPLQEQCHSLAARLGDPTAYFARTATRRLRLTPNDELLIFARRDEILAQREPLPMNSVARRRLQSELDTLRDLMIAASMGILVDRAFQKSNNDEDFESLLQEFVIAANDAFFQHDPARGTRYNTTLEYPLRRATGDYYREQVPRVRVPGHKEPSSEEFKPFRNMGRLHSQERENDLLDSSRAFSTAAVDVSMDAETVLSWMEKHIDERSREIVRRRLGFEGEEETLATIGNDFGISKQRAAVIQAEAIQKLRERFSLLAAPTAVP